MKTNIKIFASILIFAFSIVSYPQITKEKYRQTVDYCVEKLMQNADVVPEGKYPIRTQGIGDWDYTDAYGWTSGFYPGCLWLANLLEPDQKLAAAALKFTQGLEEQQYNTGNHDVGFMILSSYGNAYKLNPDTSYKRIILQTANSLSKRFNPKVGCTQSWNGDFQVIIDNMMNLELLFWAAKNGSGKKYYDMAVSHANTTIKNQLREDGSSFHVVVYDTATGNVIKKRTAQGYSDSSVWARGQAWGIYGFTMCYRETHYKTYLNTAVKMADYFIDHLPADYIPYWDFMLPADSDKKFRDASAAAIALSGLLELRNYVEDKSKYDTVIKNIMNELAKNYLSKGTGSAGLILHCAYNVNSKNEFDHDASTIWGDYYFLESLIKYKTAYNM